MSDPAQAIVPHPQPGSRPAGASAGIPGDPPSRWVSVTQSSIKRLVIMGALAVVALSVGIWAFDSLGSFLFLLLLAWLLSIAMEPPVGWLVAHGVKRGLASGIVLLLGMLVVLGVGTLFGGVFVSQITSLASNLPSAVGSAISWINTTFHTSVSTGDIESKISENLQIDKIWQYAGTYGGGLLGVFGSFVTFIFDAVTVLVFAYYLSADSIALRQTIGSWLPPRYQRVVVTVWQIAVEKTGGYVVSKVVLALASAAFHSAFFWFIGIQFWLPLGILAGVVGQFVPTIGTYIGVALPALFALIDKPINALWIVVFATIYQQIENYVFTPRISQRTMDVHPAVALASVFIGAALFGAIGAIIGIPIAAALLTIMDTFRRRHQLTPELAELEAPPADGDALGDGAGGGSGEAGRAERAVAAAEHAAQAAASAADAAHTAAHAAAGSPARTATPDGDAKSGDTGSGDTKG